MKVAFLSREYPPDSAWGGIATVYHTLACALAARGHEVHVICQAASEPRDFIDNGVFVHKVGTNPKRYSAMARINYSISAWLKLKDIIKRHDIEIVEAVYWGAEALLYSLKRRAPLVVRIDTSASDILRAKTYSGINELLSLKVLSCLEDFSAKRADLIVANSRYMYASVLERLHIDSTRVYIVQHAIDTERYKFVESDIRERLALPRDVPLVLFVGRLEAIKGHHILCQAIPQIIRSMPTVKFVLVGRDTNTAPGGGSVKSYINEQARNNGFGDNLVFIDFLPEDELIKLYSACDLVISHSLHESFGLVVVEAIACGKPVVATSTGIVPELGLDGKGGIVVEFGDAVGLAEATMKMLSLNDKERKLVAEKNRELVVTGFSIPAWVDKVIDVYEKALSKRQSS
jgi:glycosyltransferase involved in cell wall biosynthesis